MPESNNSNGIAVDKILR